MKRFLFTGCISILIFSACKKNNTNAEITGSWRLTEVFDKTSNTIDLPPQGSNMDVVLTFLSSNTFAAHTLRNTLADGSYTRSGNEIVFKNFSMTKIAEDQWGQSFLSVLYSCSLQPTSPCMPSKVSVEGNVMTIVTTTRYDITLRKL
jgi:hypothetical protein